MTAALVVFLLSYAVIAGQRVPALHLDRPAGALLGAMGMVLFGVVTPQEATTVAVNYDTLLLLGGMMIVSAYMAEARIFRFTSWFVLTRLRSPRLLLCAVVFVSGLLSAVMVNDTICLMLTPLVLQVARDARLRPLPLLLALCFGANAGSVATPTGNPQNMIIGTHSGLPYARFTAALAGPALVSLAAVAALLLFFFRADLRRPASDLAAPHVARPPLQRGLAALCLVVLCLILAGFFLGHPLSWTALTGASALVLLGRRPLRGVLAQVDFVLLVFFAGLFVVVYGVGKVGLTEAMWRAIAPRLPAGPLGEALGFGLFTVLGSQVVSNVPFVLLAAGWVPHLSDPPLIWLTMALFATLAGNLTIVGSVANMIVLEGARDDVRVGFFEFLRHGLPVTMVTLLLSFFLLYAERRLGLL